VAANSQCPTCGANLSANADKCPKCRAPIRSSSAPPPGMRRAPQVTKCPRCGAGVQRGDVICVACGTNLLTGKRVTVSSASSELPTGMTLEDAKPWIWVGSVALVLVAAFVCVFFFFLRDYTTLGKRLLSEGNYDEAADHFRTAIERNRPTYDAHFYLGVTQSLRANYDEAAYAFAKAAELKPSSVDAHLLLGLTHGIRGRIREEIAALERVIDAQPENVDALLLLALAYGLEGDTSSELARIQDALELKPIDATAHYFYGLALSRQERYDDAISEYRKAISLGFDSAADAHLALGMTYQAGGAVENALVSLRNALQQQTEFPYDCHYHLGLALAAKGMWQEARGELSQAVQARPSNAAAGYFLGAVELTLGNHAAASSEFTRIVELGDAEYAPQAHIQLALIKLKQGESGLAEDELQQAIAAQPDNVTARVQLGMLLKKQPGRESDAIRAFRSAIDLAPANPAPHLAFAIFYVERKNNNGAISEFKRYLSLASSGDEADAVRRIVEQLEESAQT
jgi:tetratricopeptide (TPR) repeat protein